MRISTAIFIIFLKSHLLQAMKEEYSPPLSKNIIFLVATFLDDEKDLASWFSICKSHASTSKAYYLLLGRSIFDELRSTNNLAPSLLSKIDDETFLIRLGKSANSIRFIVFKTHCALKLNYRWKKYDSQEFDKKTLFIHNQRFQDSWIPLIEKCVKNRLNIKEKYYEIISFKCSFITYYELNKNTYKNEIFYFLKNKPALRFLLNEMGNEYTIATWLAIVNLDIFVGSGFYAENDMLILISKQRKLKRIISEFKYDLEDFANSLIKSKFNTILIGTMNKSFLEKMRYLFSSLYTDSKGVIGVSEEVKKNFN